MSTNSNKQASNTEEISVLVVKSPTIGDVTVKYDSSFDSVILAHKWSVTRIGNNIYVMSSNWDKVKKKSSFMYMHRLLTGFKFPIVDHINRNTLDNRLCNLRGVTKSVNGRNRIPTDRKLPTGVYRRGNRFFSRIHFMGISHNAGTFDTIEDAVQSRQELAYALQIEL